MDGRSSWLDRPLDGSVRVISSITDIIDSLGGLQTNFYILKSHQNNIFCLESLNKSTKLICHQKCGNSDVDDIVMLVNLYW